jgi:hypothetical protein
MTKNGAENHRTGISLDLTLAAKTLNNQQWKLPLEPPYINWKAQIPPLQIIDREEEVYEPAL